MKIAAYVDLKFPSVPLLSKEEVTGIRSREKILYRLFLELSSFVFPSLEKRGQGRFLGGLVWKLSGELLGRTLD